jgi:hypothetical protein
MKRIYVVAFLLTLFCTAFSQSKNEVLGGKSEAVNSLKSEADSAYAKENYVGAAHQYEALLKQGSNADVYYNLGNCYYRLDNIPRAVLNYERALLLSPGDDDIRFNLDMARNKTIDKITPESEMFFVTWCRQLANLQSVDGWSHTAIGAFVIMLFTTLLYLFSKKILLKKIGFFSTLVLLVFTVLFNIFAFQQKTALDNRSGAIVMASSVTVKSTPTESGTDLFVLHEGTRVEITDDSMHGWKAVKLADGKQGWIPVNAMERI